MTRDGKLSMRYSDTTVAFDPTAQRIDASDDQQGGRGLKLVGKLPKSCHYRCDGGWNIVDLQFGTDSSV